MLNMKKILVPRLQDRFLELVGQYQTQHDMNQKQLCELVGIPETHLPALKPKAPELNRRILSMNYIFKFILKGVFSMADIYDGKTVDKREEEAWEICELCEDLPLLKEINKARKAGCDIKGYVRGYLQGVESSKKT